MSARYGRSELWYDYIDMHAIALANTCDLRCRDTREEQYNAIVQKYDEKTVQQFAVLTAITMTALLENPEQDFLGTVYHNLGLSKSRAGQFFTPYNVGQMMARMNMPDSFVLDKTRIWRVNDPCCGAGCLLLAGYNAMREQLESTDPDWDKYVLFVAQDIDPLVCKMCYIQMCCIGVPGVVVAGNSLFPDAEREPTDFWFTHKYFALDEKALEIRQTGGYVNDPVVFVDNWLPNTDAKTKALLVTSLEAVKNQDNIIGVQQESVEFHRAVSASVNSVDFGEFAKCLANDRISIGRNRLMAWLRKEKYIDSANVAYQRYIDQEIFEVKETVYYVGTTYHTSRKTLITPKGQVYLAKKVSKGYKG